ncbi:related to A.thaliana hyp1 protein [Rhynchosporium secalis]|uniref:Related to A.thaliana hyp1 protein n=1 Tax=Rhynchosporium secalis TaxID=38038 RepID=A0A1E1M2S4_RHYSE|nr:related to A.thaliana hyp1 protein [Rhynchosporium secalis]
MDPLNPLATALATALAAPKKCTVGDPTDPSNGQKQIWVQLVLSLALGLSAFIGFCFLRPRWKSLYAARKRQADAAADLPELPDSFFGWVPVLYKVTEQDVLASAGLDAYVFLAFFKMSIKLFGTMLLFACVVLAPINYHFDYLPTPGNSDNPKQPSATFSTIFTTDNWSYDQDVFATGKRDKDKTTPLDTSYLWAYLFFTYFFTALAIWFMTTETQKIIRIRQDYLGSQSTVTDRTIKLSGIPRELRSEAEIKDFLEKLEIGKVESVTLCRDWEELDKLVENRAYTLRKLEEAWAVHLGRSRTKIIRAPEPIGSGNGDDDENDNDNEDGNLMGSSHITAHDKPRPTTRIWYGFLKMQSKKVDAIDYYEEQLRKLDDKITAGRKKEYTPTPLAFVTMDSIPACQMAVQALLDPSPMQLLAKLAPAPTDVVWRNTYMPRSTRMIRSWIITAFIIVLTIFWLIPVVALAGLVDLCSIQQVWPQLAGLLERHEIIKALVQTGLPTLVVSLLNIAVPFLYDYLANYQGMISQGDVELSVISKNFFFTFFNVFLVFTAFGTASKFWPMLQESLKDTTKIAYKLAGSVQAFAIFYVNFILLQAVGLLPFRLLEFGSVALYPIMRMGSKTPRDFAELVEPPVFKYGFYLPTAILVYILCFVYSILPAGYMVLFFGLIYFVLGYYTYKYQLLYAMDHPQHATGGAWPMICYRILLGLGVFQIIMAGIIALKSALTPAALVVPLIPFTIWYSYYFGRIYEPLMKFIALRSIRRESSAEVNIAGENIGINRPPGFARRESTTLDEEREKGLRFMNPSLSGPLGDLWLENSEARPSIGNSSQAELAREDSARSSVSLGDAHIWRDNGDANV